MENIETVKTKYVVDIPINRNPFLDEQEAISNGYTEQDAIELLSRANTYLSSFLKTGYCLGKPILVAHCEENDTWYLVDGIGRRAAMLLADMRGNTLPFEDVPILSYTCKTLADVRAFTEHNNILKQKEWSAKQKAGAHAKAIGGEAKDIYDDMIDYQENVIKTKSMHIVGDIYFADKWSKMDGANYNTEDLRCNHEAYKEAYKIFVNEVGTQFDKSDNGKLKRDVVVRGQNPGLTLMSYLRYIEKLSLTFGLNPKEKIVEVTREIVARWADGRCSQKAFFESMTLNKSHKLMIASQWNLGAITFKVFKGCPICELEVTYTKWVNGDTTKRRKVAV